MAKLNVRLSVYMENDGVRLFFFNSEMLGLLYRCHWCRIPAFRGLQMCKHLSLPSVSTLPPVLTPTCLIYRLYIFYI